MLLLYEVSSSHSQKATIMTLLHKLRSTRTSPQARARRDVSRALRLAPTRASREELLNLANMGR